MAQNFNQQNIGNQNIGKQAFVSQNLVEQNPMEQTFVNQTIDNQVRPTPENQPTNHSNRLFVELTSATTKDFNLNIVKPQILAKNFELKLVILQMLQSIEKFNGQPSEDPHIAFAQFCDNM